VTYQETLDFLYPLHRFGIKPGLERVRELLQMVGSPEHRLGTAVHVAGTNGKGTVASLLASMFRAAGLKTALYTSPHLVDFTERMRIDGLPIPQERVAYYASLLKEAVSEKNATFFEATTAIAFAWFADEGVDVSVIETGMGGRLDATNVVRSSYAVITGIGLDHTDWLGTTIGAIAGEKAAIIKPGSRVFSSASGEESLAQIRRAAEECDAPLHLVGKECGVKVVESAIGRLVVDLQIGSKSFSGLEAPLTGAFHSSSLALAVMVAVDAGISEAAVRSGLLGLHATGYRGRLELIASTPSVLLDVSHNAYGVKATVDALLPFIARYDRVSVLLGLASDKNARAIIRELLRLECRFVVVDIPSERSVPAEELQEICRQEGGEGAVAVAHSVGEGMRRLLRESSPLSLVLVTGSFYLAGALLDYVKTTVRAEDGEGDQL